MFTKLKGRICNTLINLRNDNVFDILYFKEIEKTTNYEFVSPFDFISKVIIYPLNNNNFISIDYLNEEEHD